MMAVSRYLVSDPDFGYTADGEMIPKVATVIYIREQPFEDWEREEGRNIWKTKLGESAVVVMHRWTTDLSPVEISTKHDCEVMDWAKR
jgi:hypothetical protein